MDILDSLVPFIIGIILPSSILVIIFWFLMLPAKEKYKDWFRGQFADLLASYGASPVKQISYINIHFPAYAGYLFTEIVVDVDTYLPPKRAKALINKIFINNLSLGLLTLPGFPFVFAKTFFYYFLNHSKLLFTKKAV